MPDPALAEFNRRFWDNHRIEGYGLDVETHIPCPFCAAPDFVIIPLLETEEAMQGEQTCAECGRSGRHLFDRSQEGVLKFEFVQTAGDDPPSWLLSKPRRVSR